MSAIFNITHDSGDFSEWSSEETNTGNLTVSSSAALARSGYGLRFNVANTNGMYLEKDFSTVTSGDFHIRFYLDVNSLSMTSVTQFWILQTGGSTGSLGGVGLIYSGASYYLQCGTYDDSSGSSWSNTYLIADEPIYVELYFKRATNSTSSDGYLQFRINGVVQETLSGVDNYDLFAPNYILVGSYSLPAGVSGAFYMDEFKATDDSATIGPIQTGTTYSESISLGKIVASGPSHGTNLVIQETTHAHSADGLTLTQVHNLTIQEALHGNPADDVALTQLHKIAIQETSHNQPADNVDLTQVHKLTVQETTHANPADNLDLTQVHNLTINEATNNVPTDSPTLTQVHNIQIQETLHAHTADPANLVQQHNIAIQETSHTDTADNLALTQVHNLTVQETLHNQPADNVDLTQVHKLTIQEANHAHTADNLTLTAGTVSIDLTIQEALHAHSADNLKLVENSTLTIQESNHAHSADNLALTQVHQLTIAEDSHAQTADNVTLVQQHKLTVDEDTHAHTADNLTLTQVHKLAVDEATHAVPTDNLTLTQLHRLVIQETSHNQTADNVDITSTTILVISETTHAHTADNLSITQVHVLAIAETSHQHTADNLDLTQVHKLAVDDSTLAVTSDGPTLENSTVDLVIQDAAHSQYADTVTMIVVYALIIANTRHLHSSDNLDLTQDRYLTGSKSILGVTSDTVVLTQVHKLVIQDAFHGVRTDFEIGYVSGRRHKGRLTPV